MKTIDFFTFVHIPNRIGQDVTDTGEPVRIMLPSGLALVLMGESHYARLNETLHRLSTQDGGTEADEALNHDKK